MAAITEVNDKYVRQEIFDIHLQGLKDRAASEVRVTDTRFERLEAIMEKNLSEVRSEIKIMNERIDKNLAEYKSITSDIKAEVSEIRGDVKALNASVQSLQQRRSWDIAWISLAVAIGIALIQIFSK